MNPLSLFVGACLLGAVVLVSLDPVTACVALAFSLMALIILRPKRRRLIVPFIALTLSGFFAGVTTLLYGQPSGGTLLSWGPVHITTGSQYLAVTIALRILAVGLPGIIVFAYATPGSLADALGQVWRLPARFVVGALSSVRLIDLLRDDWQAIGWARRARGMRAVGHGLGSLLALPSMTFALFVRALRRANLLSTAMEARGLGGTVERSWARPSRWSSHDWLVVILAFVAACSTVTVSVLVGSWRVVYG